MPTIVSAMMASNASGFWRDERINDDRAHVDPRSGLAYVVDALGPKYGGYYAPFAIDPGLATLTSTFSASDGRSTHDRLAASLQAAHAAMNAMNKRYERERAGRFGLEAARDAADAVRPPAWRDFDSLAHFTASITACAVGRDAVVIAQVGECRAYRLDRAEPELLLLDHTLPSALEASGASREKIEEARHEHSSVVLALLGGETFQFNVVEVSAPAVIALVTNGVWRCESELQRLAAARTQPELGRLVARCATESHDDATALIIEVC